MQKGGWALALTALVASAGCLSGMADEAATSAGLEDALAGGGALVFTKPVNVLSGEGYGYEPSISVGPDGTLYVTAHKSSLTNEGTQLSSWFKFSTDDGATWQDVPSPHGVHEALYAFEGDIAIDAEGRVYALDTYLADNTFHVWRTGANGPEWERSTPVQGTLGVDDRPWLDAHGDGRVYYLGNNGVAVPAPNNVENGGGDSSRIWFYRSTDAAESWSTGYGFASRGWCGLDANKADSNTVIVACNTDGEVLAYVSHDGGVTFETVEVGTYDRSLSVPVTMWLDSDDAGNTFLAWIDRADDDTEGELFVARSTDLGDSWDVVDVSHAIPAEAVDRTIDKPWVSAGSEGVIALTFYERVEDHETLDDGWYAVALVTEDALAPTPEWVGARVMDAPSGTREYAPGDFFENAIGPDDALHVVFHGVPTDDAGVVSRSDRWFAFNNDILHTRQTAGPNLD